MTSFFFFLFFFLPPSHWEKLSHTGVMSYGLAAGPKTELQPESALIVTPRSIPATVCMWLNFSCPWFNELVSGILCA